MRRDNWFGTAIFVFVVVFIICGLVFFKWPDFQNKTEVNNVLHSRSVLTVSLTIGYDKPPIYQERYAMNDNDGTSTAQYRVQGYSGKVVTVTLPPSKSYDVPFFFQEVVQDGIWQLTNKPAAGNTSVHYTIYVRQVAGSKQGVRIVTFTDPKYWAVTAGRQYQIRVAPAGGVTKLVSTTRADPRYLQIVDAFRRFGPPSFRSKVAQAQALVRNSR